MDKHIENDLLITYNSWINSFMEDALLEKFDELVSTDINGYGTTKQEKIFGVDHVKEYNNSIEIIKKQYSNNDKCAIILAASDVKNNLKFRISTVLFHENDKWQVVHWHGSIPVETDEGRTWHTHEWKRENERLQEKVDAQALELRQSLEELKATQTQLIQSEKLASLGQLAAGIAHEIKNPMNFINNFSELSLEYIDEIKDAFVKYDENLAFAKAEIEELLDDISENLKKIHHHGTRADNILKSMLMHSRGGTGKMEPTDLNELIKEYVNLAFHGMRASKTPINVKIDLNLDESIGYVLLNTEDFSRVVLNLCKNAFDAMRTKSLFNKNNDYQPILSIKSFKDDTQIVHVVIEDNGPGVSDAIREKLFQPFFTTKKGSEGTGLGLSISNDIITKHDGRIEVVSKLDLFTRFHIYLPQKNN